MTGDMKRGYAGICVSPQAVGLKTCQSKANIARRATMWIIPALAGGRIHVRYGPFGVECLMFRALRLRQRRNAISHTKLFRVRQRYWLPAGGAIHIQSPGSRSPIKRGSRHFLMIVWLKLKCATPAWMERAGKEVDRSTEDDIIITHTWKWFHGSCSFYTDLIVGHFNKKGCMFIIRQYPVENIILPTFFCYIPPLFAHFPLLLLHCDCCLWKVWSCKRGSICFYWICKNLRWNGYRNAIRSHYS